MERLEVIPCLRLNAPEWFEREDFRAWLNGHWLRGRFVQPATWHIRGTEPNEYSDVFTNFDHGEGWDQPGELCGLPNDIWQEIERQVEAQGLGRCLIWISNLKEIGCRSQP